MTNDDGNAGNVFPWQIRPSRENPPEAEPEPEPEAEAEPEPEAALEAEPDVVADPEPVVEVDEGPPTEAMSVVDLDEGPPTEAMSIPGAARPTIDHDAEPPAVGSIEGTELIRVPGEHELDDVFGHDKFTDHEPEPIFVARPRETTPRAPRPPRTSFSRNQKILLWSAGIVLALLALLVLYFLGTRLAGVVSPAPTPTPTPTVTQTTAPTPEPTAKPVGPVVPGDYDWTELLGGECLDPYVSPWKETFTVVDCAAPHAAQLLGGGDFPEATTDAYPGEPALQAQINVLCTAPTIVDYGAAGALSDIVIAGSYPVTEDEWADGYRSYSCFATRSSGEPLTGSIAVAPTA